MLPWFAVKLPLLAPAAKINPDGRQSNGALAGEIGGACCQSDGARVRQGLNTHVDRFLAAGDRRCELGSCAELSAKYEFTCVPAGQCKSQSTVRRSLGDRDSYHSLQILPDGDRADGKCSGSAADNCQRQNYQCRLLRASRIHDLKRNLGGSRRSGPRDLARRRYAQSGRQIARRPRQGPRSTGRVHGRGVRHSRGGRHPAKRSE